LGGWTNKRRWQKFGDAGVERLMAGYEASGLSRVEFCRKHGISLSTLVVVAMKAFRRHGAYAATRETEGMRAGMACRRVG
jgi:hypothetical protein